MNKDDGIIEAILHWNNAHIAPISAKSEASRISNIKPKHKITVKPSIISLKLNIELYLLIKQLSSRHKKSMADEIAFGLELYADACSHLQDDWSIRNWINCREQGWPYDDDFWEKS